MAKSAFVLTRDVTSTECPWLSRTYRTGEVVYEYTGYAYGVIRPSGIAVQEQPDLSPFFELPRNALRTQVHE